MEKKKKKKSNMKIRIKTGTCVIRPFDHSTIRQAIMIFLELSR
jgi:hypothetical protein